MAGPIELTEAPKTPREPRIRFYTPGELRDYQPEKDVVLVGDCHLMRGEVTVIAGEPGVGKSLAMTALAVAGATCRSWLGMPVHRQFKMLIIQTENGRYRLRQEYAGLDCEELEDWIRVSEPPPFGLTLDHPEFQEDIRKALDTFKPDCVALDPWNSAAKDDKVGDYSAAFDALRNLLPTGKDKPALVIAAHTRKPHPNEKRTGGTGLMHTLAGSYLLTSVPRSIFIMVRGTEDETDNMVVLINPKNSNGQHAPRAAWHRTPQGFTSAPEFDWKEFEKPAAERKIVTLEHLREVFDNGAKQLSLNDAQVDLAALVEISAGAAYNALSPNGKFSNHLIRKGKHISFEG